MSKPTKLGLAGCCPPVPGGPGVCGMRFRVFDCATGKGLSGATVSGMPINGSLPAFSSTTDSTGLYTYISDPQPTNSQPTQGFTITVSYGGCSSAPFPLGCGEELDYWYCKAKFTVVSDTGGTTTGSFDYCSITQGKQCGPLIGYGTAGGPGYLTACGSAPVPCGGDVTLHLSPAYYADCYLDPGYTSVKTGNEVCGILCTSPNPQIPASGLIARRLVVSFRTLPGKTSSGTPFPANEFANDEGKTFTLDVTSDVVTFNPNVGGDTRTITWSRTGGADGNYQGNFSHALNNLAYGLNGAGNPQMDTSKVAFDYTTQTVTAVAQNCQWSWSASYGRYRINPDGSTFHLISTAGPTLMIPGKPSLGPFTPVRCEGGGPALTGGYWLVELDEVPCAGTGIGPGIGIGSGAADSTAIAVGISSFAPGTALGTAPTDSTASGYGASVLAPGSGIGTSSADSSASAIGITASVGVGSSNCDTSASGVGSSIVPPGVGVGTAASDSSASGVALLTAIATGTASADSAAYGFALSMIGPGVAVGSSVANSTATAVGTAASVGVGSSATDSAANASGTSLATSVGSAVAGSAANAVGQAASIGVGSASANSTANAAGSARSTSTGTAAATSTASGAGASRAVSAGTAATDTTANAVGTKIVGGGGGGGPSGPGGGPTGS